MQYGLRHKTAMDWIIVALVAAAIYVCWPLWPALVLAAWTAAFAHPMLARFEQTLSGRRHAAAALSLLLLLLVVLPILVVALGVVSGAQELLSAVAASPSAKSALEAIAAGSGSTEAAQIPRSLPEVVAAFRTHGAQGFDVLMQVLGAASTGIVGIFIYLCGAYVFLLDGAAIRHWIERQSPLRSDHLARMIAAFQEAGRGLIVGIGLTSATQGAVATLVYLSLGIPRWWVLGAITGLASVLPLVGSALVWGPIAIGLLLTGSPIRALILAVIGVAVIGTVDNVMRPFYSRIGALRMPVFTLFVSIFGGMAAFGGWGVFLGPLIVRLLMEALDLRREGTPPIETTVG